MEGAVVCAFSAALHGQIAIHQGVVQQKNFPSYALIGLAQSPKVDTYIVPSTRHPGGACELGVPLFAPAVANALFVLSGKRFRALPLQGRWP